LILIPAVAFSGSWEVAEEQALENKTEIKLIKKPVLNFIGK
jgi:hypothetical protein